jgi:predicted lipid-binding transport protein (Tim44 family)
MLSWRFKEGNVMPKKICIWLMITAALLFIASPAAAAEKNKEKGKSAVESSCVAPAKGPLASSAKAQPAAAASQPQAAPAMARVGKVAPDFEANAFVNGAFKNLKLSDNRGKWTVLCFYPGDFTFV